MEEKKEEAKKPAAVAKKVPAVKTPVKVLKYKTWEVSNYVGETVEWTADEIQPGMTFNFYSCEKCTFVIPAKCKNVMMSRCKKSSFTIDSTMSMVEMIRCEDVKLYVITKIPTISVQLCNGVLIFVTHESKDSTVLETTAS